MKRFVAALGAVVLPIIGLVPTADAAGYGVCTLSGTITFKAHDQSGGDWFIGPAILDCQGVSGRRRLLGKGSFTGSGTYASLAPAGGCLEETGKGTVEYRVPTTSGDILLKEAVTHTLAAAGVIDTETIHGLVQLAPNGDCLTKPVARTSFVSQILFLRYPRDPTRPAPRRDGADRDISRAPVRLTNVPARVGEMA